MVVISRWWPWPSTRGPLQGPCSVTDPLRTRCHREWGDFPTPAPLAERVCRLLAGRGIMPAAIVEPTCGAGRFLLAALDVFPGARRVLGIEINTSYITQLKAALNARRDAADVCILEADIFQTDWGGLLGALPEPILVVGNPPWVTSAAVGRDGGTNLPGKTNAARLRGIEARTGKSNFDISEWLLVRLLDALQGRAATLAVLCKTAVGARSWRTPGGTVSRWTPPRCTRSTPPRSSARPCRRACSWSGSAPVPQARNRRFGPPLPSIGRVPSSIGWGAIVLLEASVFNMVAWYLI